MACNWLAAYTRPRHEMKVREYCEARGLEVFLPTYKSWRNWSDRRKLLELPLFPSYVFLRLAGEQRGRAVQAPGFLWFVHNDSGPVFVNEDELVAIRRLLDSGLAFDPLPAVGVGDGVEIVHGALRGCRGKLISKEFGKVALFVSAINGGVRICLPDPSWIALVPEIPTHGAQRELGCRGVFS